MFHSVFNPKDAAAVRRSSLAIMLKTIHLKTEGLVSVSHYHVDNSNGSEYAMMSLGNGFRVLCVRRVGDAYYLDTVDQATAETNLHNGNFSNIAQSKNTRYLTSVVCTKGKEPNKRLMKTATYAHDSHLNNTFNSIAASIRELKKQTRTPSYSGEDVSALLEAVLGNGQVTNLPTAVMMRLEAAYNDFKGSVAAQSDYEKRLKNVFNTDKWLVIYSPFFGQDNYFVGALDAEKFTKALNINQAYGVKLETDSPAFTLPLACYRSIADTPDSIRGELSAALTMSKLFLDKNHSHLRKRDAAGYIPAVPAFLFDDNVGLVACNRNGAVYMLIDK